MARSNLIIFQYLLTFLMIFNPLMLRADEFKRIGVIVALSGPIAEVGGSVKNGIELAKKDFDKEGKIKLFFEDDQFQPKNSVSAAWKLIDIDHVDALIVFGGSTSNAVADIAEKKKIPMMAITALSNIGKDKSYVSSLFISTKGQIDLLSKASNFNRIALVTNTQEALLFLRDQFVLTNPGKIVASEEVVPGELNVSSIVTKVRFSKPDAVVLFVLPPQVSIFSKQLRAQGFKGQFLGGPPMFNSADIKASMGALTGAWLPGPDSTNLSDFLSNYESLFKNTPNSEGIYAYDSAHIFIDACRSKNIQEYLSGLTEFTGLAGRYPKNASNAFEVPAELREIGEDGKLKAVKKLNSDGLSK